MRELTTIAEMRAWSRAERARRHTIGFVPTMGYLHEGHLRLVDRARELADRVVVSIFVNPLQFGPHEDLARYPRDLPRDRQLAAARDVDCLFVPPGEAMYPGEPLARARGRVHRIEGVRAVATFHPRWLLQRPSDKALAWRDLLLLMSEDD